MGTIFVNIQSLLDPVTIFAICMVLFAIGYWLGTRRSKKLTRQIAKMEKKIMDLNTELLYGPAAVK